MRQGRFCKVCKRYLPIDQFIKRGTKITSAGKPVKKYEKCCKSCYSLYWQGKMVKQLGSRKKQYVDNSDKRVTIEYVNYLYEKQKGKCYWLGIPLNTYKQGDLTYISMDRLDNTKGYTKGNVVLTTKFANLGRHVASKAEMLKFVREYFRKK